MEVAIFLIISVTYLALAERLGKWSITMPMFFVSAGLLYQLIGVGVLSAIPEGETVQLLAEMTLTLLLFADASTLKLRNIMEDAALPGRLLLVALPLIIGLGALVARLLFPELPLGLALLIASILAPTDAALGLPIFTNKLIPVRIRRALNVESGLNDGIATPFVTLFLALTLSEEGVLLGDWIPATFIDLGGAILVGIIVGFLAGRLMWLAQEHGWASKTSDRLAILVSALACYWVAIALDVNGFVAAFVGGLVFGAATMHQLHEETEFTEDVGTLFSLVVWTLFGAMALVILKTPGDATPFWRILLYAVLSLTLIRMVPVALSMWRTGLRWDTIAIMGWFGPRGMASVVFLLLTAVAFVAAEEPSPILLKTVSLTVLLSVFLHGITARPFARWYARRLESVGEDEMEMMAVSEMNPRRGMLGRMAADELGID